ncbi:hypothetical protein B0H10DRAFT_2212148 [Mycena sp. CBHHK59/15]|nr:hypothetical protein B0H10DRAFT_2212148 [Mycena sp. CBHHK59/15]
MRLDVILIVAGTIAKLIDKISKLSESLPTTIPEGTEDDKIHYILMNIHSHDAGSVASTFNHRFNILFKEDAQCRDEDGHLRFEIDWVSSDVDLELARLKLERVVTEMELLCKSSAGSTSKKPTACKAVPAAAKGNATAPSIKKALAPKKSSKELMLDNLFDRVMQPKAKKAKPDKEYQPKKALLLSEEEEDDFEDGEADAVAPEGPRKRKRIIVEGEEQPQKKKPKTASAPPPGIDIIDVESDDKARTSGKRGLKSTTRDHFFPPVVVTRTVSKNQLFGDEDPQPALGNLAMHYKKHAGAPLPDDVEPGVTRGISAASAKIMEDFLVEGKLNPTINTTQKNFYKIFSAWIIEDDLLFSTGETVGINRLFRFMHSRYELPSDTTVHNTLAKMYTEMYDTLISELAAQNEVTS